MRGEEGREGGRGEREREREHKPNQEMDTCS